jgi:hypothetical protein
VTHTRERASNASKQAARSGKRSDGQTAHVGLFAQFSSGQWPFGGLCHGFRIEAVKESEVLYNMTVDGYKNTKVANKKWDEIVSILGMAGKIYNIYVPAFNNNINFFFWILYILPLQIIINNNIVFLRLSFPLSSSKFESSDTISFIQMQHFFFRFFNNVVFSKNI